MRVRRKMLDEFSTIETMVTVKKKNALSADTTESGSISVPKPSIATRTPKSHKKALEDDNTAAAVTFSDKNARNENSL